VVLDEKHLALDGLSAPEMLSAHVFASHRTSAIADAWVAGRRQVSSGRHALHDAAASDFVAARYQIIREGKN
jgi:formimidoylglutamate deiminase